MRGPQKNRAAGSQEEHEAGNSCGHPINFKPAESLLQLTAGLGRRAVVSEGEIKAKIFNYLPETTAMLSAVKLLVNRL